MMNPTVTKLLGSGFKYAYIIVLFAMLSAVFYPVLNDGRSGQTVVSGIVVLLFSLGGGILLYKAATSAKRRGMLLGAGLGVLALAALGVYMVTGRVAF